MNVVYFLVILLAVLLIYTVVSTITKLSLYLTTRTKYDNIRLFIPFILTVILWSTLVVLCLFTINKYLNKNVFEEIINLYLKKESLIPILRPITVISSIFLFIGIILQSLTYFSTNIPLEVFFGNIRCGIKKLFKFKSNPEHTNIVEKEQIEKLGLGNAFLASLFSTFLIILAIVVLAVIGLNISYNVKL